MLSRLLIVIAGLAVALTAKPAVHAQEQTRHVRSSRITLLEPTKVCNHYLLGTYVVVHDEDKMARDEPCTTFYMVGPKDAAREVVSFHCIPRASAAVSSPTITVRQATGTTTSSRVVELLEYQLPGETEAHGVPQ